MKEILIGAVLDLHQQAKPVNVSRCDLQRAIEKAIVAFNPEPVEAMEILHSISRALSDRYGEDRTKDVRECIGEVEDALCELENTLGAYAGPDEMDLSREAAMDKAEEPS